MGIAERKGKERAARESRIVAAARAIAEREGWDAVTIRRLPIDAFRNLPPAARDELVAALGDKVTVQYSMTATSIESKAAPAKAEKKAK